MDMNKMTQKSQEALAEAQNKAVTFGHQEVNTEHLLIALLEQPEGLVGRMFRKMDVPPEAVVKELETELRKRPWRDASNYRRKFDMLRRTATSGSCWWAVIVPGLMAIICAVLKPPSSVRRWCLGRRWMAATC